MNLTGIYQDAVEPFDKALTSAEFIRDRDTLSHNFLIKVIAVVGGSEYKFRVSYPIHDDAFVKSNPDDLIAELQRFCYSMLAAIPEIVIGKYPFTRLWADKHLILAEPLLFNPTVEVPGWVHNKYRKAVDMGSPRENSITPCSNLEMQVFSDIFTTQKQPANETIDKFKLIMGTTQPIDDEARERLLNVATTTDKKKKVVRKAKAPIDPSKIKKPLCPLHNAEMGFDKVRGKWKCQEAGCKMSAKPVRDEDDREVQLGKGSTQVRIVATADEIRVLLISDDNLALDITGLIAGGCKQFIYEAGLAELAEAAVANNRNDFVHTDVKDLELRVKIGVIGADDLLNHLETV